jgi:hypothetical protein
MPEKYDLNKMLAEIEEDEAVDKADKGTKLSQEDIRKLVMEKRNKKRKGA